MSGFQPKRSLSKAIVEWMIHNAAASLTVVALVLYADLRLAYSIFYSSFKVAPEEIGIGYTDLLSRSATGLVLVAGGVFIWLIMSLGADELTDRSAFFLSELTGTRRLVRKIIATVETNGTSEDHALVYLLLNGARVRDLVRADVEDFSVDENGRGVLLVRRRMHRPTRLRLDRRTTEALKACTVFRETGPLVLGPERTRLIRRHVRKRLRHLLRPAAPRRIIRLSAVALRGRRVSVGRSITRSAAHALIAAAIITFLGVPLNAWFQTTELAGWPKGELLPLVGLNPTWVDALWIGNDEPNGLDLERRGCLLYLGHNHEHVVLFDIKERAAIRLPLAKVAVAGAKSTSRAKHC